MTNSTHLLTMFMLYIGIIFGFIVA